MIRIEEESNEEGENETTIRINNTSKKHGKKGIIRSFKGNLLEGD